MLEFRKLHGRYEESHTNRPKNHEVVGLTCTDEVLRFPYRYMTGLGATARMAGVAAEGGGAGNSTTSGAGLQ